MTSGRVYLDNAATSWPKPDSVYDAVDKYQRQVGAPAARAHTADASMVDGLIRQTRLRLAELIGCSNSNHLLFAFNGTDALNLAIFGLLRSGDHVIVTDADHNSVLRPLRALEAQQVITVSRIPCDTNGTVSESDIAAAIEPNTRLICLVHASNVTGSIQPVDRVGQMSRERGIALLVDAAQSLGHIEIDVEQSPIDLLAAPGHKGCLGPLGTGMLYVAPNWIDSLQPLRYGGTGTQSDADTQPESLPDRFESGNANVPGLVGLGEGVRYVLARGVGEIRRHETAMAVDLIECLRRQPNIVLYGHEDWEQRIGVISFRIAGQDPRETSTLLDQAFHIQTRAGFHCAPRIHAALDTTQFGGTVRLSPGCFNSPQDVDAFREAIESIVTA